MKTTVGNADICREWVQWLRDHGRTPLTCYQYAARMDEFLSFVGGVPLANVTLDQLEAFVARPRRGHGGLGADATRHKEMIVLRSLWKWGCAHGRLVHNPTLDLELPTVKNVAPKAIPQDLWASFFYSPAVTDVERVVYGLGFYCGLRREEMCRLEVGHVKLDKGMIDGFKRKGDRNSKHSGTIPVVSCARLFAQKHPTILGRPDDFLGPLEALLRARDGKQWLVPWGEEAEAWYGVYGRGSARPVAPRGMTCVDQINNRLRAALARAGLAERAFTPHATRHSFVTYMLKADVPIQTVSRLANHSSLNVTMRYVTLAQDPLAELLETEPLKGSRW